MPERLYEHTEIEDSNAISPSTKLGTANFQFTILRINLISN